MTDFRTGNWYQDNLGDWHMNGGTLVGAETEGATIKGFYKTTLTVAVPTIADAECDLVAVDTSALTVQVVVGDQVIVTPTQALPTDCLFGGAYVSATDEVTISFMTKEGGSGVTGANKTFDFLIIKMV